MSSAQGIDRRTFFGGLAAVGGTVATCRFGIDVHAVSKHMNKTCPAGSPFKKAAQPYQIPLRACRAADLDNLYMAGRCISGDFFTQASYRITGKAVEMGYNVGKAAACANGI